MCRHAGRPDSWRSAAPDPLPARLILSSCFPGRTRRARSVSPLGNAGAAVLHAQVLSPGRSPACLEPDLACRRRELDCVSQEIKKDLAPGAVIGPEPRLIGF